MRMSRPFSATVESEPLINAELTTERFDGLALEPGELVSVSASRVRVFPDEAV